MRLRVYGWGGFRSEAASEKPYRTAQTREICAARSMAAAARIAGEKYARNLFNACETGNAEEIQVAMTAPGVIFWKQLDDYGDKWRREGRR